MTSILDHQPPKIWPGIYILYIYISLSLSLCVTCVDRLLSSICPVLSGVPAWKRPWLLRSRREGTWWQVCRSCLKRTKRRTQHASSWNPTTVEVPKSDVRRLSTTRFLFVKSSVFFMTSWGLELQSKDVGPFFEAKKSLAISTPDNEPPHPKVTFDPVTSNGIRTDAIACQVSPKYFRVWDPKMNYSHLVG